jgi:hypothetical protein
MSVLIGIGVDVGVIVGVRLGAAAGEGVTTGRSVEVNGKVAGADGSPTQAVPITTIPARKVVNSNRIFVV